MRPEPLARMSGRHGACQFMPAEDIGFELRGERGARQVFDRARLAIGAVVEERIELAAGAPRYFARRRRAIDCRLGIVEIEGLEPFAFERGDVVSLARRGEDAPAARLQAVRAGIADAGGAAGDEDAAVLNCRLPAAGAR